MLIIEINLSGEECEFQTVEERVQTRAREYFTELLPAECLHRKVWKNENDKKPLGAELSSRNAGACWKPYFGADEIDVVGLDTACAASYLPKTPCSNGANDFTQKGPQERHSPGISTPKKNFEQLSHMLALRPLKNKQLAVSTCTPDTSVYSSPKSRSEASANVSRSAVKGRVCQGKKRLNFHSLSEDYPFTSIKRKRNDESCHIQKSSLSKMEKRRMGRGKSQTPDKSMNYSGHYNGKKKNDIDSDEEEISNRKSCEFEDVRKRKTDTIVAEKQSKQKVPCVAQSWQEKKENMPPDDLTHTFMPGTPTDLSPTLPRRLNRNEIDSPETTKLVIDELEEIEICNHSSGRLSTGNNSNGVSSQISWHSPHVHSPKKGDRDKTREGNGWHANHTDAFYPLSKLASVPSDKDGSSADLLEESSFPQVSSKNSCEENSFISPLPGLRASCRVVCAPRKVFRLSLMQASPHCRRNLTRTFQAASPHTSSVKWHDTPPDSPWRREQMLPQMEFDSD